MYKLHENGVIIFGEKSIPPDPQNSDYREYLAWLEMGNVPDSADPLPATEIMITPSQQIILSDGNDIAKITITGEPGATVDYTVNGQAQTLVLGESGIDTLELTCDTPNTTLLIQAGTAKAVIFAVEVPL